MSGRVVRYSEAFKLKVVDELEQGVFCSPFELARAYGIGTSTVTRWVRQYGKSHLLKKVVRVEKEGEPEEFKRLLKRVKVLEEALADAHLDAALNDAYLELICEQKKVDKDVFKKKLAGAPSITRINRDATDD